MLCRGFKYLSYMGLSTRMGTYDKSILEHSLALNDCAYQMIRKYYWYLRNCRIIFKGPMKSVFIKLYFLVLLSLLV